MWVHVGTFCGHIWGKQIWDKQIWGKQIWGKQSVNNLLNVLDVTVVAYAVCSHSADVTRHV